jgi:hypothetical protein
MTARMSDEEFERLQDDQRRGSWLPRDAPAVYAEARRARESEAAARKAIALAIMRLRTFDEERAYEVLMQFEAGRR